VVGFYHHSSCNCVNFFPSLFDLNLPRISLIREALLVRRGPDLGVPRGAQAALLPLSLSFRRVEKWRMRRLLLERPSVKNFQSCLIDSSLDWFVKRGKRITRQLFFSLNKIYSFITCLILHHMVN